MLATRSETDAVPITISGSRAVLAPRTYYVRGGAVEVTVGKPIGSRGVSATELANRVREEILATFDFNYEKTLDRNTYSLSRKV